MSLLKLTPIILLLLMVVLFLPFPSQIMDAVTQTAAAGYSVSVSAWRIAFEPFTGPFIFLMRSSEPLKLYSTAFLWLIAGLLVLALLRKGCTAGVLLEWLKNIPVYISMFVSVLLVIIFAPLPGEVIVNHHQDTVLVNFHSHSYYSHDGLISPQRQVRWHKHQGFDAFFLTEHNHHEKTLQLVESQHNRDLSDQPLVLPAQEYSGSNHLLLLGLNRVFNTKNFTDQAAMDSAHAQNGVAIVAHWFTPVRNTRPLPYYLQAGADGCEIVNQAEGAFYPEPLSTQVIQTCQERKLVMVSACDYHGYGNICQAWTAMQIPGWRQLAPQAKQEAILQVLRNHDQGKIQVLVLRDRPQNSFPAWIRPWATFWYYVRNLNVLQIFSWIFWIFLLFFLKNYYIFIGMCVAFLGPFFTTATGIYMLYMVPRLQGYNDIFLEYGGWFLGLGITFLLYSILKYRKNLNIFSQNRQIGGNNMQISGRHPI
jgi:hypothetical protein